MELYTLPFSLYRKGDRESVLAWVIQLDKISQQFKQEVEQLLHQLKVQWNLSVTVTLGTMLGCYTEVACL